MSGRAENARERNQSEERGGHSNRRDQAQNRMKPRIYFRKKVCKFCTRKMNIGYKDIDILKRFTTERGKIMPRRITGTCAKHQRKLAQAIKRARVLAMLPFVAK